MIGISPGWFLAMSGAAGRRSVVGNSFQEEREDIETVPRLLGDDRPIALVPEGKPVGVGSELPGDSASVVGALDWASIGVSKDAPSEAVPEIEKYPRLP